MSISATRYPNGLTTSLSTQTYGNFLAPDPTRSVTYYDDFSMHSDIMLATPTSHTVTATGTFTRAFISPATGGGNALFSTGATSGNGGIIQHKSNSIVFDVNKSFVIKVLFQTNSALNSNIFLGVSDTSITSSSITNGIGFGKSAGETEVFAGITAGGVATVLGADNLADATSVVLGLRYDARSRTVDFLINEKINDRQSVVATFPEGVALTPTIMVFTGAASASTVTLDYISIQFER